MADTIVAVADIGSSTVHLLVARLGPDGALQALLDESVRPLLGARAAATGSIPPDAEADVLAALRRYQAAALQLGAATLLIVATQAVRQASNGVAMIRRLQAALNQPVVIISPEQETRLALLGAYGGQLPPAGLFADSGGASTQVAAVEAGRVTWQRSLPVGASSLTGTFLLDDPATPTQEAQAIRAIEGAIDMLPPPPGIGCWLPVITGGTATTIVYAGLGGCSPAELTPGCLAAAESILRGQSSATLSLRHGMDHQRARIVYAGCLVIRRLIDWSTAAAWRVSTNGLREGIVRAAVADPNGWQLAVSDSGIS